jgi:hypothetical protein
LELFGVDTWLLFQAAIGVKPHELAAAFGIMGNVSGRQPAHRRHDRRGGQTSKIDTEMQRSVSPSQCGN